MIGKTLGHYQITEKLGEGGMGVVYKARDTHLDRLAALKVLPPERVSDSDRKRRFIQEAKAASALNHPSIITIYDIDQAEGIDFIAMEYVAGKTLDELIPRKGMRLSLALKYAVQIADALARAHGAGIIHRDLKPSNVMVDEHGLVKVLDFGLAKLTETAGPEAETAATRTGEGTVLGTAAYMSPEQAEGKHIDTRSDIFSFGSMLYEMLTGQRAFRGDTRASTIASILREDPKPISQVAEGLPRDAEKIVRRCLRKDPEHRFQTMADLRVALEELKEESDSGMLETVGVEKKRGIPWILTTAVLVVALSSMAWWFLRSRVETRPEQTVREIPFTSDPGLEGCGNFSPDGSTVAFMSAASLEDMSFRPDLGTSVQLKMIGAENTQVLKKGAFFPVWSPDGNWVAFSAPVGATWSGKSVVSVIPRIGGVEKRIAEVQLPWAPDRFASWTPDGKWLVSLDQEGEGKPFHVVLLSVETGEKLRLTAPPERFYGDLGSALSPDGRTLVFTRCTVWGASDLYLLDLDSQYHAAGEPKRLTEGVPFANCPVWMPDGQEIIFCSRVWHYSTMWRIRKDGAGGAKPLTLGERGAYWPDVSRKGSRLLYTKHVWDTNILRVQLQPSGHAAGAAEEFIQSNLVDGSAAWSPDGRWIAFASERSGGIQMWLCNPDGTNPRQLTAMDSTWGMAPAWSPDSQWIAFTADQGGTQQLYVLNIRGGPARKLTSDPVAVWDPQWSGDGRWIYFWSNRTGSDKVWKVPGEGGAEAPAEGIRMGRPDPDRAYVYYARTAGNEVSIWRESATGGQTSKVLAAGAWDFAVSRKGLYYAMPGPPEAPWNKWVAFYEFASERVMKIADLRYGTSSGTGFAVSPDGHYLLYTQSDRETNDLMLVENFH